MKNLIWLLLIICIFSSCRAALNQLPKPSGKYQVGVKYFNLTDTSRKELFDNELARYRELTIKVWYPSDARSTYEPYLENAQYIIDKFQFSEIYRTLLTNSYRDVPVSSKEKTYPVLIFSHGWGEHFSQNTILMEELASHGYVVFSIAHHCECKFSFYPDGTMIVLDFNSNRFNQIMNEQQNPDAMAIFQKMTRAGNDQERMSIFTETNNLLPTLMMGSSVYWADDIRFLIDMLEKINNNSKILKGKLNLQEIGVLGMSMGGIATHEVCIADERVKAGINIDGALYGPASHSSLPVPFLFLNSQRYLGYGNLFVSKGAADCYSITIPNCDHYNFTDYALYPIPSTSQIGSIDAHIPLEMMDKVVLAFFDKYLKNQRNISIPGIIKKYDVEYVGHENGR